MLKSIYIIYIYKFGEIFHEEVKVKLIIVEGLFNVMVLIFA
jgi:hypothetical protein